MRAFARDLDLSPQYLSNVINGKKGLSTKTASQIAKRLGFTKNETEYFCNLAQSRFSRNLVDKKIARARLATLSKENETTTHLAEDAFRVISDWYHFAIIELLKLKSTESNQVKWLSKR